MACGLRTFSSLMSRWAIESECMYSIATRIWPKKTLDSLSVKTPCARNVGRLDM